MENESKVGPTKEHPLDTEGVQTLAYLDGGSLVDIEIKKSRTYLTFKHSHKRGVFKMEIDEVIFEGANTPDARMEIMIMMTEMINKLVGAFDGLRGQS